MIRKTLVVLAVALLFSSAALTAQVRTTKPNDFTLELGGKCLLYSLGYQRTLSPNFGLEAAISYFGAGSSGDSIGVFLLGGGARLYFIKKDASPYISGGIVWASAGTSAGPFGSDSSSGVYFYASPGFEYRMAGGFLFRAGVYLLFVHSDFFVWPGITLGIAF
jgi:hypothetical protein